MITVRKTITRPVTYRVERDGKLLDSRLDRGLAMAYAQSLGEPVSYEAWRPQTYRPDADPCGASRHRKFPLTKWRGHERFMSRPQTSAGEQL